MWGEAILTSNHILNKIAHKKNDKTPYALWKGHKPTYKYFKVAKVGIPNPKQVRIGPKTVDCIFIGHAHNSSAYRFIVHKSENSEMNKGMTIESRNAVYFENVFPSKERKEDVSSKRKLELMDEGEAPVNDPSKEKVT